MDLYVGMLARIERVGMSRSADSADRNHLRAEQEAKVVEMMERAGIRLE